MPRYIGSGLSAWLVRVGGILIGSFAVLGISAGVAWSASGWTAYVTNATAAR